MVVSGMLRCQVGAESGDRVIDVNARVVVSAMVLLCAGLTACSSSQTETAPVSPQAASPASSTAARSRSPEGPVATITPTPVTSPESTSAAPSPSPTASPSVTATDEPDEASRAAVPQKPKKSKKPKPASAEPSTNCDPNYSGACVPIVSWDLDCADIGESVTVIGSDIHRFDADGDGEGCESF